MCRLDKKLLKQHSYDTHGSSVGSVDGCTVMTGASVGISVGSMGACVGISVGSMVLYSGEIGNKVLEFFLCALIIKHETMKLTGDPYWVPASVLQSAQLCCARKKLKFLKTVVKYL